MVRLKTIKLRLARHWLNLVPTDELRDEIFSRAMSDWYKGAVEVMLGLLEDHYGKAD